MWRLGALLPAQLSKTLPLLFPSVAASTAISVSQDGKRLSLAVDGEPERRYHGVWLRHNCRCPQCLNIFSNQNIVHHSELMDLSIKEATINDGLVNVKWDSAQGSHSCSFDVEWLKEFDYSTPDVLKKKAEGLAPIVTDTLPTVDYKEIVSSDEGLYKWLRQANFYGVSLIRNMPTDIDMVEKVLKTIANPQEHAYRLIIDIVSTERGVDAAYTTDDLLYHMDQGFYESSPGLQIIHCLKFDDCVEGGESYLVDVYDVAQRLKSEHPHHFKTLTEVPYTAQRVHHTLETENAVSYNIRKPHITLDNSGQIISLNWSPQFHGPLQVSEEKVADFYEAFIAMSAMLEDSPNKVVYKMKPGDALCFNNRRMVHSRNAFQLNGGERHLRVGYVNIDDFKSKFQFLASKLGTGETSKHVFNSSWTTY